MGDRRACDLVVAIGRSRILATATVHHHHYHRGNVTPYILFINAVNNKK